MRKLIVHMDVGFAGMDAYDAFVVPDQATNDQINEIAYQMAINHAESYGYYPRDEYSDIPLDEDEEDYYVDSIYGTWEDYDPEKHDMYRPGGGSFELDFKQLEMIESV